MGGPSKQNNNTRTLFSSHGRRSTRFDQVGGLLADAVGGHLRVAAVQFGHDADVNDAQVARAADAELGVDDRERVVGLAHAAGAGGMVACFSRF